VESWPTCAHMNFLSCRSLDTELRAVLLERSADFDYMQMPTVRELAGQALRWARPSHHYSITQKQVPEI
jgi:hypothetical protein